MAPTREHYFLYDVKQASERAENQLAWVIDEPIKAFKRELARLASEKKGRHNSPDEPAIELFLDTKLDEISKVMISLEDLQRYLHHPPKTPSVDAEEFLESLTDDTKNDPAP
jgi:hypothetical protein